MAGGAGIAGAALSGLSLIFQGMGQKAGYEHEAQKSELAARIGTLQGVQLDTQFREELGTTLANIRAIRASAGMSSTSPTGLAITGEEQRVSDRQRLTEVGNKNLQASVDRSDALFYRQSARTSLFGGVLRGIGAFAGGVLK